MPRQPKIPSYRLHKPSGQAVVTLSGRDYYLGPWGETRQQAAASWAEYDRLVAEWLAAGRHLSPRQVSDVTVAELVDAYLPFATSYYVKDGRQTQQLGRVKLSLSPVLKLYGHLEAAKFGPLALKAVRQQMIGQGWARKTVNSCVGCVKRAFAWGVSEELIPSSVSEGLRTVRGLSAGRTEARETERVPPAPEEAIPPVLERVLPPVATMINLQLLTAMRPGEVTAIRPGDIEREGAIWHYRPRSHKTEHHGADRVILVGPKAQELLRPWLVRPADRCCFSPREATQVALLAQGRKVHFGRKNRPGDRYPVCSYSRAIRRACRAAGVTPWHPHQLRHNAATRIVAEFGWDVARIILGHRTLSATRIYGEDAERKAAEAIARIG